MNQQLFIICILVVVMIYIAYHQEYYASQPVTITSSVDSLSSGTVTSPVIKTQINFNPIMEEEEDEPSIPEQEEPKSNTISIPGDTVVSDKVKFDGYLLEDGEPEEQVEEVEEEAPKPAHTCDPHAIFIQDHQGKFLTVEQAQNPAVNPVFLKTEPVGQKSCFRLTTPLFKPRNAVGQACSIESVAFPGYYLRHANLIIKLGSPLTAKTQHVREDFVYTMHPGLNGGDTTITLKTVQPAFNQACFYSDGRHVRFRPRHCPTDAKFANSASFHVGKRYNQIQLVQPKQILEQQCFDRVQNAVAWNKAGTKTWNPRNVRNLCKGVTNIDQRITCFSDHIKNGKNWSEAIELCKWTKCANERQVCSISGPAGAYLFKYGIDGRFTPDKTYNKTTDADLTVRCDNATHGDPVRGKVKACWFKPHDGSIE